MVSSYQISERVNLQSVLWAMATGIVAAGRAGAAGLAGLWAVLVAVAPWLVAVAAVAGIVAIVAMIPVQFWLCLAGLVVGAYVTYPRCKAVK